jgi:hypothetical protein
MAIFGAGSGWGGNEMMKNFFNDDNFVIGWDYANAKDLFDCVSLLKTGDIVYLKANKPGSRSIRVKGIGIVTNSFVHHLIENRLTYYTISDWNNFSIPIKWIIKDEFQIEIPETEGKLTNVRSATFYEEHLPFVQQEIVNKLFDININQKKHIYMDYNLGQFVTGIISVGLQVLQMWKEGRSVQDVQSKVKQFDEITSAQSIFTEGKLLESLVPYPVLNTLKGRVEICWTDFNEVAANQNLTPRQMDRYTEGLRECICRELKIIKRLNGSLPTKTMQDWWDGYQCA